MANIFHFSDYTPGVKAYTPEMGERKPACKIEARLCHYGKHYYIDTSEAIKGRGIEFLETYVAGSLTTHGAYKTGWSRYRVTSRSFEILKDKYPICMAAHLD